jgi:hypothetical protein
MSKNMRDARIRDMLAAIAEWSHATAADRDYWRGIALDQIREFRRRYLIPERAAFEAAVARNRQLRRAA